MSAHRSLLLLSAMDATSMQGNPQTSLEGVVNFHTGIHLATPGSSANMTSKFSAHDLRELMIATAEAPALWNRNSTEKKKNVFQIWTTPR